MSDVDVVREIYECMASRDLERLVELIDPECVITQDPTVPWGGRFEGHDGFATFALTLTGTITSAVTIDALFACDGDVIEVGRTKGTVNANGAAFDVAEVHRWTLRDGRAVRAHFSIDNEAMLAAIGSASS